MEYAERAAIHYFLGWTFQLGMAAVECHDLCAGEMVLVVIALQGWLESAGLALP